MFKSYSRYASCSLWKSSAVIRFPLLSAGFTMQTQRVMKKKNDSSLHIYRRRLEFEGWLIKSLKSRLPFNFLQISPPSASLEVNQLISSYLTSPAEVSPSSAHRARGGGEENKIQSNVTTERENRAPAFFRLISGCAAAKVDAVQQLGRRLAAGIGSTVCAAPTSALLAPLVHTGGRAAPSQALSLRTRNPLSQSGVTQKDWSC